LNYRLATSPGSGGAPCFDARLNLVAMHQSGDATGMGAGLVLSAILHRLEGLLLGRRTL
jgi:hypothetical protein